jgi:hypothetical protein
MKRPISFYSQKKRSFSGERKKHYGEGTVNKGKGMIESLLRSGMRLNSGASL